MRSVEWMEGKVRLIDQTRLPDEVRYLDYSNYRELAQAISDMVVRGAPAIGVTAAMGMALAAQESPALESLALLVDLKHAEKILAATRPTAVNLFWALGLMLERARTMVAQGADPKSIRAALVAAAIEVGEEDEDMCRRIGDYGAELVKPGAGILTHCNAGGLATAGYGTALGVIRSAHRQGKKIQVLVDETRPRLQGARLTAWELQDEGVPYTIITDNMAGHFMARGRVDLVVTGADRIAANGDTANKIGTYSLAVLAQAHSIPFYIAAPFSTIDHSISDGGSIPIEERPPAEVTEFAGHRVAPAGARAANPAFDVTPRQLITAIITEVGVLRPPYETSLKATDRSVVE